MRVKMDAERSAQFARLRHPVMRLLNARMVPPDKSRTLPPSRPFVFPRPGTLTVRAPGPVHFPELEAMQQEADRAAAARAAAAVAPPPAPVKRPVEPEPEPEGSRTLLGW